MAVTQRSGVDRVSDWFFAPQPVYPLVLARILFGTSLCLAYLGRLPHVEALFGPHGVAGPEWIDTTRLALYPALRDAVEGALDALPGPSLGLVWLLYVVEVVAAFCFAIGFRTRTAGVVALLLHVFFVRIRLPLGYWGWAFQIQPMLAYVICSRAGQQVSIDAWRARRAGAPAPDWVATGWPMRLLQVHVCTMYLVSGGERLDDPGWIDGQAIWVAMTNILYSKWGFDWHELRFLFALGSWATFVFEPVVAVGLWFRRVGPVLAYLSIAMHVTLEILVNVGWWNFVMIGGLLSFVPFSHTRAVVARLPGGAAAASGPV